MDRNCSPLCCALIGCAPLALLGQPGLAAETIAEERPRLGGEIHLAEALGGGESSQPLAPARLAQGSEEEDLARESDWSGTFELYGFAPLRTRGTTTIRGLDAEVDLDFGEVLDVLKFAASGRGSVEKGRTGLMFDAYYTDIGDAAGRTLGRRGLFRAEAEVSQTLGIYDLALRYRFGDRERAVAETGSFNLIPYAGARIIDGSLDLSARLRGPRGQIRGPRGRTLPDLERSFGRTWTQALVGVQGSYHLTPRLRLFARGDVGGFGLGGEEDFTTNAQAGVGYAVGNSTDLNLSWRYLELRYNNGGDPDNGYTLYQNGVELGVKFFFGGAPSASVAVAPAPEPEPIPAPEPEPFVPEPVEPVEPVRGLW